MTGQFVYDHRVIVYFFLLYRKMDESKRIHRMFSIGWKEYSVASLLFFHVWLLLRLSSSKMIRIKRRHLKETMRLHYCYSETVLWCHVHKGHVEFYLRQWAKKEDEVVSPLDLFHLSFPASRFPSHSSPRPRANLRATISVPFHLSLFFHLSFYYLSSVSFPSRSLSCFLSLLTFLCFHVSLPQPFLSVFVSSVSLSDDPALSARCFTFSFSSDY